MERRFKTSNHSNEQAKRISIEASSEQKNEKDDERCGRYGAELKRKRWPKKARRRSAISFAFNRGFEDADDYDSSGAKSLPKISAGLMKLCEEKLR